MKPITYPTPILERYKLLFKEELEIFLKNCNKPLPSYIRANTLKIAPEQLKKRLEAKGWKVTLIPFYPDAFTVETEDTLGNTIEHFLGYYYVQDAASMLPPLILNPKPGEKILDLCAAPGSKTTELAQLMNNEGTIVANEADKIRSKALSLNIQRCGIINTIITKHVGQAFAKKQIEFDKILVDAPCSAEGTVRNDWKVPQYLSLKTFETLPKLQYELASAALTCLKKGGVLVYSTCTFAPEENEAVVHRLLENNQDLSIERIGLPGLKTRQGITNWKERQFNPQVKDCIRIVPYDNDTEGFFVAKLRKA
ncbi:RsmB/NOP family class I SAM-dependent RNA methyltransferase [Candidatus Woesearchaeota archaeon]|nr:RsmB/NOP family class I SAM-dependent RNA methyltransferase [Candidatus Woesearchaeota archaeon]